MTTWEALLKEQIKTNVLLEQLVNIWAENTNLQLDIVDKLEMNRINNLNTWKNTRAMQNLLERRLK